MKGKNQNLLALGMFVLLCLPVARLLYDSEDIHIENLFLTKNSFLQSDDKNAKIYNHLQTITKINKFNLA